MMKHCLNWKVFAGLALVGLGVWFVAPGAFAVSLPLLLLAACPLSMMVMMRAMGGMKGSHGTPPGHASPVEEPAGETLADLKARLVSVQAEQETLARTVARLEAGGVDAVAAPERARALAQPHGQRV